MLFSTFRSLLKEIFMSSSFSAEKIVFFDGVCGLCNRFVDFLLRKKPDSKIKFAALQGDTAAALHIKDLNVDSIVYFDRGTLLVKSDAVLAIFKELGGWYRYFYFLGIFPKFLRDFFYDIVARNRYAVFGKRAACRLPSADERQRFLN